VFIVCEGAACVLAVLTAATLLFAACAMFLLALRAGGGFLALAWRKIGDGAIQWRGRRMPAESQ